jgi:hexosaminidase
MNYLRIFFLTSFFIVSSLLISTHLYGQSKTDLLENVAFIPLPQKISSTGKFYTLKEKPKLAILQPQEEAMMPICRIMGINWEQISNNRFSIQSSDTELLGDIRMSIDESKFDKKESYKLQIEEDYITITAGDAAGVWRGWQTLYQIILFQKADGKSVYIIPTGTIEDEPYYEYRGVMLDVARHFFSVEEVKAFIDQIAMYKINYLHLHLTDDQGWRIEIDAWPNLTKIGGSKEVGGGDGSYYTKLDYKELVRYAAERFITIVPEVDMPGHTNAALASYPELNCDDKAPLLYTGTKVGFSSLCVDKDITYKFIGDVVREIAEITPGPYFHIGGDESDATEPQDYVKFINKVAEIVKKNNKTMIGWDDISTADLSENWVAQHWHKKENGIAAKKKGGSVIMSPASRAYLDMKYDTTTELGLKWAGLIEVDHGYDWYPEKYVDGISKDDILGVEAPLWSETIDDSDDIEFLAFPRILGYAEIGWSKSKDRNWNDYKLRLAKQAPVFELMGINFYRSTKVKWR